MNLDSGENIRLAILGFGSIARKHLQSIQKILSLCKISILTSQEIEKERFEKNISWHDSIESLLKISPDYCIIATPANIHGRYLNEIAKTGCRVLIEKPLAATSRQAFEIIKSSRTMTQKPLVAYNLRFSKALQAVRACIANGIIGEIYTVQSSVGQDLGQWRPDRKLSDTVSASRMKGGGVLRELSHELDYLQSLFGKITSVNALLGRQKFLDFDVEDTAMIHCVFDCVGRRVMGSLNLDFIRQDPLRNCHIIGSEGTIIWDLLRGRVTCNDASGNELLLFNDPADLSETNERMWRAFLAEDTSMFTCLDVAASHISWIEVMEEQNE